MKKTINTLLVTCILVIKLKPKTSAHVKSYDGQTKWMYFFIKDGDY